jgi:DNA-binding NtrC family response regulator
MLAPYSHAKGRGKASPFTIWLKRVAVCKIQQVLLLTGGDKKSAARMIGIDRSQMYRLLFWNEHRDDSEKPPH